mmetsp:Transcript_119535/g.338298  ORF Transcript_119535/g.338298 Transcript_119535/m.338298 type:complete len:284 (-) Transcript_119535:198-1049(-)
MVAGTGFEVAMETPGWRRRASTPTSLRRAEAELRSLRLEADREKLRMVLSYPFFGTTMAFRDPKDAHSTLQISSDGRFSYSISPDVRDSAGTGSRRAIRYEGVLAKPSARPKDEGAQDQETSSPCPLEALKLAVTEGRGLGRMESDELDGQPRLCTVERGEFRFAIQVRPFFQPTEAWVLPLFASQHLPQRKKHLARVGDRDQRDDDGSSFLPGSRQQGRRRSRGSSLGFTLVASRPQSLLQLESQSQPFPACSAGVSKLLRQRLSQSASAPILATTRLSSGL